MIITDKHNQKMNTKWKTNTITVKILRPGGQNEDKICYQKPVVFSSVSSTQCMVWF